MHPASASFFWMAAQAFFKFLLNLFPSTMYFSMHEWSSFGFCGLLSITF
jgi:hypothetical protein